VVTLLDVSAPEAVPETVLSCPFGVLARARGRPAIARSSVGMVITRSVLLALAAFSLPAAAPGGSELQFTSALGDQLLQEIPSGEPVEVDAIGSASEQEVGLQIAGFLRDHGYVVFTLRATAISPPPDGPLTVIDGGWKWYLEVAPGVR
jgi:hypothetical protein